MGLLSAPAESFVQGFLGPLGQKGFVYAFFSSSFLDSFVFSSNHRNPEERRKKFFFFIKYENVKKYPKVFLKFKNKIQKTFK